MNKNNENKLVPKLRFPEFRNEEGWEVKEIGEVFDVTRGYVLSMNLVKEKFSEENPYPVFSSQTKNNGLAGFYEKYLYEDAITWTTDGANAGDVNFRSGKFYCTNVCGVLINKDGNANPCVAAILNSVSRKYVSYVGNPKLMNGVMSQINIPFPKIKEQQKIADCLLSLDEVITAENQRLKILQEHKKGLLQNLLPQAGETVPKFRFKEFKDCGEWIEKKLDEIAEFLKGKGISKADVSDKGKQPCIRYGELYTYYGEVIREIESYTNLAVDDLILSEANDVIIPSSGETKEDIATASCVKLKGVALGGDLNILRSTLNGEFLAYYLSHGFKKSISRIAQGDAVVHLYSNQLKKLSIRVPSKMKEQEIIADTISSIVELINTQIKKVEALQLHKKGILQGLFPTLKNEE